MEENYKNSQKKLALRLLGFLLLISLGSISLHAQSNSCAIRVDQEPKVQQLNLPLPISSSCTMTDPGLSTIANDEIFYENIVDPFSSDCISFDEIILPFNEGTEIYGVGIEIIGFQDSINHVEVKNVQFIDAEGNPIGQNKAGKNVYGKELSSSIGSWQYGHGTDQWEMDLNSILIKSKFGFQLEFVNETNGPATFSLDQVELIVYYKELYTICDHYCSTFYVDPQSGLNYAWEYENDINITSESEHSSIINLDFTEARKGLQTLCVSSSVGENTNTCCRDIFIDTCGNASISGRIWEDINLDGNREDSENTMQNIEVVLFNIEEEAVDTVVTDMNGDYLFNISESGFYYLEFEAPENYRSTLFQTGNSNRDSDGELLASKVRTPYLFVASAQTILNIDFGIYQQSNDLTVKIFEDIYGDGTVLSSLPLTDKWLILKDTNDIDLQKVKLDSAGSFTFDGLEAGKYKLELELDDSFDYSKSFDTTSLDSILIEIEGDNTFEILLIKYSEIGDYAWNDENSDGLQDINETGIANVGVRLLDAFGTVITETLTNENGYYTFSRLFPQHYQVQFLKPSSYEFTIIAGIDSLNSNVIDADGKTNIFQIVSGSIENSIDAGFAKENSQIIGYVWNDKNKDGLQDAEESGLEGIQIILSDEAENVIRLIWTDENGEYQFTGLDAGIYQIAIPDNLAFQLTSRLEGSEDVNSDLNSDGKSDLIVLENGRNDVSIDIGLYACRNSIGDFVWLDSNRNGTQEPEEIGISGIEVLLKQDSLTLDKTRTNISGYYHFENVPSGEYEIEFKYPSAFIATEYLEDVENNSDVVTEELHEDSISGRTALFLVEDCMDITQIDLGLIPPLTKISGTVWEDKNSNGIFEPGEEGINEVKVYLYDENHEVLDSVFTGVSQGAEYGQFTFAGDYVGNFYLVFVNPNIYSFSETVGNEPLGTTVTGAFGEGSTDLFTVELGDAIHDINCGLYFSHSSIGDYVWFDRNENGIQDETEEGLADVKILLYTEEDFIIDSSYTNDSGNYSFPNVPFGSYYLVFEQMDGYEFTILNATNGDKDSDADQDGKTAVFEVDMQGFRSEFDCGYQSKTLVGDFIWNDLNKDGIQNGEPGLSGVKVSIFDQDDFLIDTTISDQNGAYYFFGLKGGEYYLQIEIPENFQMSVANAANDLVDNDGLSGGTSENFVLGSNEKKSSIDFGLFEVNIPQSGVIFHDANLDGIKNDGEIGYPEIKVNIINKKGTINYDVTTNQEGQYEIGILPEDTYYIRTDLPSDHLATSVHGSKIEVNKNGVLPSFISDGESNKNLNLAFYGLGKLSWESWNDTNGNGIKDGTEGSMKDLSAGLYDAGGTFIGDLSAFKEEYLKIKPGKYSLRIKKADQYFLTGTGAGEYGEIDNDFHEEMEYYESVHFTIQSFEFKNDIAAGFYFPGSVGNRVWLDENINGFQDEDEVGIINAKILLYNSKHELLDSVLTDDEGRYSFEGLKKGEYYLAFDIEGPYEFTTVNTENEERNSDVMNYFGLGTTATFSLAPEQRMMDKDAGVVLDQVLFSELMDFQGRREGAHNVLTWITRSEKMVSRYILERRKDGDKTYEPIEEIQAIDQEKEYQEYLYFDKKVKEEGNYYYRLKEYDLDGNYAYSHVIVIRVLYDAFTFSVSPNPASTTLNLQYEVAETSKVTIELLDEAGRLVQSIKDYEESGVGVYTIPVHVAHLPQGFYILQMVAGHRIYHQKLVIDKN